MPLILISNYAPSRNRHEIAEDRARKIVAAVREVCLNVHVRIEGLKPIDAAELAINAAGENFHPEDGSPIHVVFQIYYKRPERTPERITKLGQLIADAVQGVCPLQAVKVTFPPMLDTAANVIIARAAQRPAISTTEGPLP